MDASNAPQIGSQATDEDKLTINRGNTNISAREYLKTRTVRRHQRIAANSLMMLSILSFSCTFRHYCDRANESNWERLLIGIEENHESLEYFAKARGLRWFELLEAHGPFEEWIRVPLLDMLGQRLGTLREQHPHACVVPEKGGKLRPPTRNLIPQVNIANNESIYRAELFASNAFPRPQKWPQIWKYPSDPTVRLPGRICFNCNSTGLCNCDPNDCVAVQPPLVELRQYPIRGVGIRTLQNIAEGTTVGEYIGEIMPSSSAYMNGDFWTFDDMYTFDLDISLLEDNQPLSLASISAELYGNWTRYINHSCESSLMPRVEVIGRKTRMMIVTVRDIDAFEELTLNYGDAYWSKDRPCLCGTKSCISLRSRWISRR